MITICVHPNAKRVSDVMDPYAKARQHLTVYDVPTYARDNPEYAEELLFQFVLREQNASFSEFVLVRAVSNPGEPVVLYIFSKKLQSGRKANDRIVSFKRPDWIEGLVGLNIDNLFE